MNGQVPVELNNAIENNSNLDIKYKTIIMMLLDKYYNFFNKMGANIDPTTSIKLFSELSIEEITHNMPKFFYYDIDKNSIISNTKNIENNMDSLFDLCYSVLDIMCKRYDFNSQSYDDGIVFYDESGNEYGSKLNISLKKYIVTLSTDVFENEELEDDYYFDSSNDMCTLEDRSLHDLFIHTTSEELLTCFINGDGNSFLNLLSRGFENRKECLNYLSIIDKYNKENSISVRTEYDKIMKKLEEIEVLDEGIKLS